MTPKRRAAPKKGLRSALKAAAEAHPDKRLQLWFQDEARIGNKGRVCHRWWLRGQRPPGICHRRYRWTYIFSPVRPATGDDFTLVLPEVSTRATRLFFDAFAETLAQDIHAVVVLDGAGWHQLRQADIPDNVTLVPLPPYSLELNPVERVWLYLRERFLSLRVLDACCDTWNALASGPGRLQSLCAYPWIMRVVS